MHFRSVIFSALAICFILEIGYSQDVYLMPLRKDKVASKKINAITFSSDGQLVATVSDETSLLVKELIGKVLYEGKLKSAVALHEFTLNNDGLIVAEVNGNVSRIDIPSFQSRQLFSLGNGIIEATLDPNKQLLSALNKDHAIETYDLTTSMKSTNFTAGDDLKKTLAIGYERFGQNFYAITSQGSTFSWSVQNQKLNRQLVLQSGEYGGSKSVIYSATSNSGGNWFLTGIQEVFIPKGGMQGRNQPERRNMIIAYDWTTGEEVKRMPLRFRVDGMAAGPGPSHVAYYTTDSKTVSILNLEKGDVTSSVTIDGRPNSIRLSEDGEVLAIGTFEGELLLYEVVRNSPASIQITNPPIKRNIGDHKVDEETMVVEGVVEGSERISKILVNGAPAEFDYSTRQFRSAVNLDKGKNKVRVAVQNTENKTLVKDFYVTCEVAPKKTDNRSTHEGQKRLALVVGNSAYSNVAKLKNTTNDATLMKRVLTELGFDVTLILDGGYEDIKGAIYAFGDQIEDSDISLFYFAGHGLEIDGVNYLIPVDASIQSALDVKMKAIPLTGVIRTLEFANEEGLNMIILDACRNNPFPTGKRGAGQGLARTQPLSGTLIAYSTDPGSVASDGEGENGLYTGELAKQLRQSQRIEDIFMNTRNNVERLSGNTQRPWEEARLKGVFYLK